MKTLLMILFLWLPLKLFTQDSIERKNAWSFSGYLKDLEWVRFGKSFSSPRATNLVHNRINVSWNPSDEWSGRLDLRNRFYWGDDVRTLPGFKQQLRNQNEEVNLSANWFSTRSAILHSNVERLWLEFKKPKWNFRAGRQRINWGVTNTWNPNDLFNTYNFLDFDYEERPGSDAAKAKYLLNDLSNIEVSAARAGDQSIIAAKYATNYRKYDLQWNAGVYQNSFTTGFGWAGSIKDFGFKGELQFYAEPKTGLSQLLVTLEGDYIFENGLYISTAFLFDQNGLHQPLEDWRQVEFHASPRRLMPTKWNFIINASKEYSPLFSGSMNVVYAPGTNLVILFPTLRFNLKTNWDLDFVWQSFFAETKIFEAISHAGFLRLRWSY